MAASPPVAGWLIAVPAKPGRAERSARVAASFKRIEIKRPHYGHINKSRPETIALTAISVAEVDPPEDAPPIAWVLLTTHAVANAQDVARIVRWYRARWTIDIDQTWRLSRIKGWRIGVSAGKQAAAERPRRCTGDFDLGDCGRVRGHQLGEDSLNFDRAAA